MPYTLRSPEPTSYTHMCLPHTSTCEPTQAPSVPATLDHSQHTQPHMPTHIPMPVPIDTSPYPKLVTPLSLHHAPYMSPSYLTPVPAHVLAIPATPIQSLHT